MRMMRGVDELRRDGDRGGPGATVHSGRPGRPWARLASVGLALLLLVGGVPPPDAALAQVRDGATMTVLRGSVAVLHVDRSAVQPAPSAMVVQPGDEVRTLDNSGATITFFRGTEVELGENTNLVIERVSGEDGRVDISLKQVFGVTLHRVHALSDPGASYRVEVGGAVAVVRGTEFVLYGPTDEHVVGIACLDDCDGRTTFAGCPVSPRMGYWVEVERGRVVSRCQPFATHGNPWNAPAELRLSR